MSFLDGGSATVVIARSVVEIVGAAVANWDSISFLKHGNWVQ